MTAEIIRKIATFYPNAETTIEITESDDYYTILVNGKYANSYKNDGAPAYTAAHHFARGMVKMIELQARAAEDALIARAAEIREARRARKAARG